MRNGTPLSGTIDPDTGGLRAQVYTPTTHTPISGHGTDLTPRIRNDDGTDAAHKKVTRPSGKQLAAFNKLDEAKKAEEIKDAEKRRQEIESLSPHNLRAELSYLSRKVKSLEKSIKELQRHDS